MNDKKKKENNEEPSMDEILSSIRDIISDDDEVEKKELSPEIVSDIINAGDSNGVIELTEMVQGDGSILSLNEGETQGLQPPTLEELENQQDVAIAAEVTASEMPNKPDSQELPVNVERISSEGIFEESASSPIENDIVLDDALLSEVPLAAKPKKEDAFSVEEILLNSPLNNGNNVEEIILDNLLPVDTTDDFNNQKEQNFADSIVIETSPSTLEQEMISSQNVNSETEEKVYDEAVKNLEAEITAAVENDEKKQEVTSEKNIDKPVLTPKNNGENTMSESNQAPKSKEAAPVAPKKVTPPQSQPVAVKPPAPVVPVNAAATKPAASIPPQQQRSMPAAPLKTPLPTKKISPNTESSANNTNEGNGLVAGMATDMLKPILQERLAQLLPSLIDQLATPIIQSRLEQILPPLVENIVREMARKEVEEIAKKL